MPLLIGFNLQLQYMLSINAFKLLPYRVGLLINGDIYYLENICYYYYSK